MLGGEIYYRAIGRPWGPAADLIVTVPSPPAHCSRRPLAGGPGRPRAVEATRAFKFESGRQRVLRSTIRGPPARVCPTVRPSVCPPVRPVRSCCPSWKPVFRSGPVKKKFQTRRCCHRAGKRFKMNHRKPKNVELVFADTVWEFTIHTRFGNSNQRVTVGSCWGAKYTTGP